MVHDSTNKIRKTDEEATFHEFEYKEQKSPEAKFVGINAKLWEEMSVKDVTNNSLREHNGKISQTSLIPIIVSVDNQDKCNKQPRPIEVKKTTLNRYFL